MDSPRSREHVYAHTGILTCMVTHAHTCLCSPTCTHVHYTNTYAPTQPYSPTPVNTCTHPDTSTHTCTCWCPASGHDCICVAWPCNCSRNGMGIGGLSNFPELLHTSSMHDCIHAMLNVLHACVIALLYGCPDACVCALLHDCMVAC